MNVQNIPRKDKVVKAAFVPKLDAFLFFDYSNIELKLLAFYLEAVGHPSMADVFRRGADLHAETAAGILGKPVDKLTDNERQDYGKVPNFSIVYGGGVPTIMEQLGFTSKEAFDFLKAYHARWPGIGWESKRKPADPGTLIDVIKNRVGTDGYIKTLWGRHLHPRSMHSALNALCQGCAADLMKWACVQVYRWLEIVKYESHIVNVVHDEMILDVTSGELRKLTEVVPELMTYLPVQAVVPIVPEPEVSYTTWADKGPYEQET